MKRDRRSVLDLLTEQDEELFFNMFQTPNDTIQRRLPAEMTIKCTPSQGAVILKILNKAAVMDSITYLDLYQKFHTAVTGGGITMGIDGVNLPLTRDEIMKLLNAIKLTDASVINPSLGVIDAMWALRQDILQKIGIQETD